MIESALTSAGSEPSVSSVLLSVDWLLSVDVSSDVLHSLSLGKGMDRLLQILTCGFPLRWLKAVSLWVIGSLGCSEYHAVLAWLSRRARAVSFQLLSLALQVGSMLSKVLMVSKVSQVAH